MKKIIHIYKEGFYIFLRVLHFYIIFALIYLPLIIIFFLIEYIFSLFMTNIDWLHTFAEIMGYLALPPVFFYASKITGEFVEGTKIRKNSEPIESPDQKPAPRISGRCS